MKRLLWLCLAAGCTPNVDLPDVKIPDVCQQQVYADPTVKDELMKGAGSDAYRASHQGELAYAKLDAVNRCMRQKGLAPTAGRVERPRLPQ